MKDKCKAYEYCVGKMTMVCHEMCPMSLRRLEYNENDPIHLKTDKCGWKEGKFLPCCNHKEMIDNNNGILIYSNTGRTTYVPSYCPDCGEDLRKPEEPIIKTEVYSMNDVVYFKIHSEGHKILDKYAEHFHRDNPKLDIQVKWNPYKKDWYREQMHRLFSMFGDKSFSGSILPIYDLTFKDPTIGDMEE